MSTVTDYDLLYNNLLQRLAEVEGRTTQLERVTVSRGAADARYVRRVVSNANVTSPPTEAELDIAFGAAATLGNGFMGLVDDNGGGSAVWLCFVVNGSWWYEALTLAV